MKLKRVASIIVSVLVVLSFFSKSTTAYKSPRVVVVSYGLTKEPYERDTKFLDTLEVPYTLLNPEQIVATDLRQFDVFIVQHGDSFNYTFPKALEENAYKIAEFTRNGGILLVFSPWTSTYDWLPVGVSIDTHLVGDITVAENDSILEGLTLNDLKAIGFWPSFSAIEGNVRPIILETSGYNTVLAIVSYGKGLIFLTTSMVDTFCDQLSSSEGQIALKVYQVFLDWALSHPSIQQYSVEPSLESCNTFLQLIELNSRKDELSKVLDESLVLDYVERQLHGWHWQGYAQEYHMLSICRAMSIYSILESTPKEVGKLVYELRSYQKQDGGFSFKSSYKCNMSSNLLDTFWAVTALRALGSLPEMTDRCVAYVLSQQKIDGSFEGEDYSGLPYGYSRHPVAQAFYSVMILEALNATIDDRKRVLEFISQFQIKNGEEAGAFSIFKEHEWASVDVTFYGILCMKALGFPVRNSTGAIKFLNMETAKGNEITEEISYDLQALLGIYTLGGAIGHPETVIRNSLARLEFYTELEDMTDLILTLNLIAQNSPDLFSSQIVPRYEMELSHVSTTNTTIAILDCTLPPIGTIPYSALGIAYEVFSPIELYHVDLSRYKILVVPNCASDYVKLLHDNEGAIGRFVGSGGILIVLPQEDTWDYGWLPVTTKTSTFEDTVYTGSGAMRATRSEILENITSLDLANCKWYSKHQIYSSSPTQAVLCVDRDGPLSLLSLVPFRSGIIILSGFDFAKESCYNEGAKKIFKNVILYGISESSIRPSIIPISTEGFTAFVRSAAAVLASLVLASFLFISLMMTRRKSPIEKRFRKLLRTYHVFFIGTLLFILGAVYKNATTEVALLTLFYYDFSIYPLIGLNKVGFLKKTASAVITTFASIGFLLPFFLAVSYLGSGSESFLFPILVAIPTFIMLPLLSHFIAGRLFTQYSIEFLSESSKWKGLGGKKAVYKSDVDMWNMLLPFLLGCYFLSAVLISNIILCGTSTPFSSSFSRPDESYFLVEVFFILWGFLSYLKHKQIIDEMDLFSEIFNVFLTPKGLLYGFLWAAVFVNGIHILSSTSLTLIEGVIMDIGKLHAIILQLPHIFLFFIFPSYLLYHLAKQYYYDVKQQKKNSVVINPNLFLLMLLIYPALASLSTELSNIFLDFTIIIVPLWAILAISKRRSSTGYWIRLSSKLEDIYLFMLIFCYAIGFLLGFTISVIQHPPLLIDGTLLEYLAGYYIVFGVLGTILLIPCTFFYISHRLYFKRKFRTLRVTLAILSALIGSFFSIIGWWLGIIFLLNIVTALDNKERRKA
jgi:prenyltransferase beta subunit